MLCFFFVFQLREEEPDVDDLVHNWFSCQSASKIYTRYLQLDKDHNGLLSREELSMFDYNLFSLLL